jgi:hypothetical protein
MTSSLAKIRESGFSLALVDGNIEVKPASALTQQQRHLLKSHKAEIISELQAEQLRQAENECRVITWLSLIGETDRDIVDDTLTRFRNDPEARVYFLCRADEALILQ